MSVNGWNVVAGGMGLAAGTLVLVGSAAQAWGEIRRYQDLVDYGVDKIDQHLARFVGKERGRWSRPLQLAALPLIAALPEPSIPEPDQAESEKTLSRRNQARQELNKAAAWSLILLGSLLAVVAGVVQFWLAAS